jgi:hypothetical protein
MLTAITMNRASRALLLSLGTTKANVAGAGLAESGSVLDILRTSAGCADQSRHRRARSDHEADHQEQAQSYSNVAEAAKSRLLLRAKDLCRSRQSVPVIDGFSNSRHNS